MTLAVEQWAPCSDRARERADPLAGTAPRGIRWFLLEVATSWGPNALLDAPFDREIGRATGAPRRGGRHARPRDPPSGSADAAADAALGDRRFAPRQLSGIVWGEVADAAALLDIPLDGSTGTPSTEPVYAVCAHGRHDRCCAVRGRRVATALAAARPEQTWECSHVGGDRFAGTMVVFPHGLYYGYADDGDPTRIADAFDEGRVVADRLRGRSSLSHPVQAAQHYARQALGDDRIGAYPPLEELATDDGWRVRLGLDAGGSIVVDLAEEASPPLLSTCAATRLVQVRQYALRGIA